MADTHLRNKASSGNNNSICWDSNGFTSTYKPATTVTSNGASQDFEGWMPRANTTNNNDKIPWTTFNNTDGGSTLMDGLYTDGVTNTSNTYNGAAGYSLRFLNFGTSGERYTADYDGDAGHILCEAREYQTWHTGGYFKLTDAGGGGSDDFTFWIFGVDSSGNYSGGDLGGIATAATSTANGDQTFDSQASPYYNSSKTSFNWRNNNVSGEGWIYREGYFKIGTSNDLQGLTARIDIDSAGWGNLYIDQWFLKPVNISFNDAVGGTGGGSQNLKFSDYD